MDLFIYMSKKATEQEEGRQKALRKEEAVRRRQQQQAEKKEAALHVNCGRKLPGRPKWQRRHNGHRKERQSGFKKNWIDIQKPL